MRLPTGKLVTLVGVVADATSGDPRIAAFPRLYLPILSGAAADGSRHSDRAGAALLDDVMDAASELSLCEFFFRLRETQFGEYVPGARCH